MLLKSCQKMVEKVVKTVPSFQKVGEKLSKVVKKLAKSWQKVGKKLAKS
jgi:hypothetical protein